MMWLCHGWGWQPPQTASIIHTKHIRSVWAHWYSVYWHAVAAVHIFTHPTWLRFGVLGHLSSQMMSLCHDWGRKPSQSASHIHIRHIKSVWAHWYTVHRHMVAALHIYTHPTWLRFGGAGSLIESKWCEYVMVEAESHLKLLPTSILDMYKMFEHIDMLSIVIW